MEVTEEMAHPSEVAPSPPQWERYTLYGVLILVILFFAFVRFRLRNMPLERDEGEYAYSGQLMLQGVPPYKFAYNMKLPGTYAAYAAIMAIFGQTPSGVRLGLLLVNAATTVLVFLLGKRLHGSFAGVVAGSTYALLSTRSTVLGLEGHATHFVAFFTLIGILILLHAIDIGRPWLLSVSGIALGLAFLMKQHGIFFALFAGLFWLWTQRATPLRNLLVGATLFTAGCALPFLLTCALIYRAGVFPQFWFWTFSYGRVYASETNWNQAWKMIRAVGPWMIRPYIIWEIAAAGLSTLIWDRKARAYSVFLIGLLVFSLFSVMPGFYFRPHYFILLLPVVSLCAGFAVSSTFQFLLDRNRGMQLAAIPVVIFAIAFALSVRGQHKFYFGSNPQTALKDAFGDGDICAEDATVGDYIRANSSPHDLVAVLGSEPAIYFYAQRRSATGYIYMYALTEKQKYSLQMREQMIREVESAQPRFLVYVDDSYSWWNLGSTKEVDYLRPLQQWMFRQYDLQKTIPISGDAEHQWGDHPAFYIFRKRDAPLTSQRNGPELP